MSDEKSIVGKVEQNLADLARVRQKKPWLFYVLVVAFLIVAGLYVFDKFWGIPALNKQISDQKDQIRDLKSDRDAKANQLAPFLAVANKQFQDPSESDRLNKLLQQVEDLTVLVKSVSESLPKASASLQQSQPLNLDDQTASKIIEALRQTTNFEVSIRFESGQRATGRLANQLKGLFENGGWKISDFGSEMSFWSGEQPSFQISVGSVPPTSVQYAIAQLLNGLQLPRGVILNTNLPASRVDIYIGPQ
jgi:hypothetical protein